MPFNLPPPPRQSLLVVAGLAAMVAIFVTDIRLPQGHNAANAYVLIALIAGLTRQRTLVFWTAAISVALTLVATPLKPGESPPVNTELIVFSRTLAVVLILATTALVVLTLTRERENLALGRAIKSAEYDRDVERRMLASASEISPIGTWSISEDDDRFDWSDTAAAMHGQPPGYRPSRETLFSFMSADAADRLKQAFESAWAHAAPFREEVQITLPDGTERWIVKMGAAVRHEGEPVARLHGTVQDVTQWRKAELSASTQRNRFSQLTNSLPIIVWTATAEGLVDFFNEAMGRYTGAIKDELLADEWRSVVHPEDLDLVSKEWSQAVATGKPYDVEFRIMNADGTYLWHQVSAQVERDENGGIVRWWGNAINIDSYRRLSERALSLAADRAMVLESMTDGVLALDRDFRMVYMNSRAEEILGCRRDELVGFIAWDAVPELDHSPVADLIRNAHQGLDANRLTYHSEISDKWLDASVSPSAVGVTVFLRDVTDVRVLSEQLAQSQRLEAVGQLTGGIAHDFNNLLTVVLGGADALTEDDALTDEARETAAMIVAAAERGAELTHRLLAFARRQPLEPQSVDLAERLRGLVPLLRRAIGEHITMVVAPSDGDALAEVDPGQFDNAVLNLAINARDAMPEGGSLTIEVETRTLDEVYDSSDADLKPGTYVITSVTDTGHGISRETIGHLFDPFFTTKEMGKGAGLGLAMVWGFVKQSGGQITVYSEPEIGTSFKIYLPAASAPAASVTPAASTPIPLRVTGTILVAEDDDLVRRFATDRLRLHGYEVVEAGSGPEALDALKSMDRLDLLFTDVIMPGGMTGRDLADSVLELRPGTPVLFASGYTENVIIHNGRLDEGVKLLAKPYSARQLLDRAGELVLSHGTEGS